MMIVVIIDSAMFSMMPRWRGWEYACWTGKPHRYTPYDISACSFIFFIIPIVEICSAARHVEMLNRKGLIAPSCEKNIATIISIGMYKFDVYISLFIASNEPSAKQGANK